MQVHTVQPNQWISYAITAVIVSIVLFFRLRRMNQTRPLKLERLWIVPALYSLVAIGMFVEFPPTGLGWVFCALALVVGAALGWQRGKMMRISVDPETHALNQKASPAAVLFIIVLIVVRTGARSIMGTGDTMFHLNAMVLTDMLIALALGVFTLQRLEMYLRAKKLLDTARATRAA